MNEVKTLKKLLNENSILPIKTDSNNKRYYELTEPKFDYSIKISNPPNDTIVLKCDSFPDTSNFFRGKSGECKRADYIVFSESENAVLIMELKYSKDSSSNKDIIAQLKGAKSILDYCKSIAASFLGNEDFLENYEHRYYKVLSVVQPRAFSDIKNKNHYKNDIPENARTIHGKYIPFSKLLA
ncbi:MAG: hypothetical protein LBS21_12155 [Clostridiales bacterium]|jgi:hypothetical protein|nr:hypothetical protein [Clostridiales bacterium]